MAVYMLSSQRMLRMRGHNLSDSLGSNHFYGSSERRTTRRRIATGIRRPMTTNKTHENEASIESEIIRLMREARHKSRGYAEYWEWAIDKRQAELHAARVLSNYLLRDCQRDEKARLEIIENDPPDALLILANGCRIGIEVTELVDEKAIRKAHRKKRTGLPFDYDCANWNSNRATQSLLSQIAAKDAKLASASKAYDELLLVIVTDETMIDEFTAAQAVSGVSISTRFLDRAFLVLSYHPAADKLIFPDGCPIFPIELA
jgi:hypothetical protein